MTRNTKKAVKFEDVAAQLPDLEGLTLKEITKKLGYKNTGTAKAGLYYWRRVNRIDFTVTNGIFEDFELLDGTALEKQAERQEHEELTALRTWLAVSNAYRLNDLIDGGTLKPKESLEAIKELGRIERGLTSPKAVGFAKRLEEQRGIIEDWQNLTEDTKKGLA